MLSLNLVALLLLQLTYFNRINQTASDLIVIMFYSSLIGVQMILCSIFSHMSGSRLLDRDTSSDFNQSLNSYDRSDSLFMFKH